MDTVGYDDIQKNNDFLYKTNEFDMAEQAEFERLAKLAEEEEERKKEKRKSKLAQGRNWSKSKSPKKRKSTIKPAPEEIAEPIPIVQDQIPQTVEPKLEKKTPKKPARKPGVTSSRRGKKQFSKRK